jgi:hypothetical protein
MANSFPAANLPRIFANGVNIVALLRRQSAYYTTPARAGIDFRPIVRLRDRVRKTMLIRWRSHPQELVKPEAMSPAA